MAFTYITCYPWTYMLTGMNERMNQRPIFSGWRVKSSSWLIVTYNSLTSFQSGYPHGIINFHVNDVLGRNRNKQDDPVLAGNYTSLPKWSWRVVQSGLAPIQIDSCSATNSFNFLVLISLGHEPTLLLAGWSVAITRAHTAYRWFQVLSSIEIWACTKGINKMRLPQWPYSTIRPDLSVQWITHQPGRWTFLLIPPSVIITIFFAP